MSVVSSCIYHGEVIHRRLRPVSHILRYRVYNLFVDLAELQKLGSRLKFFSYNRFNLFSIHDRNFGPGDGTSIEDHVWQLVRASSRGSEVSRIFMFCYPSVLGYVFNPLTTFYCMDAADNLVLMVYEVNNTFGERHSYVIPVGTSSGQRCEKRFYVSPFNKVEGRYDFTIELPGDELKLGIRLTTAEGPCLTAWFSGKRQNLSDAALLKSFLSIPLLPIKIMGGIHWEAAKLWMKGMRIVHRPKPVTPNVSISKTARE